RSLAGDLVPRPQVPPDSRPRLRLLTGLPASPAFLKIGRGHSQRGPVMGRTLSFAVAAFCMLTGTAHTAEPALPTVKIFTTGGTIAGSGSSATDMTNYKPGAISGDQL